MVGHKTIKQKCIMSAEPPPPHPHPAPLQPTITPTPPLTHPHCPQRSSLHTKVRGMEEEMEKEKNPSETHGSTSGDHG